MDCSFEFVVVLDFAGREAKGHGYYVDFPFFDGIVYSLLPVSIYDPSCAKSERTFAILPGLQGLPSDIFAIYNSASGTYSSSNPAVKVPCPL